MARGGGRGERWGGRGRGTKEHKTQETLAEGQGGKIAQAVKVEEDAVGSTFLPKANRMYILIPTQGQKTTHCQNHEHLISHQAVQISLVSSPASI